MTRWRGEDGFLLTAAPAAMMVAIVLTVALVDIGSYLVAAARAQGLADAAALAAVSVEVDRGTVPPRQVAAALVRRGAGELEACDCRAGSGRVEVAVSVPVDGILVPRLVVQRVTADAAAELTPDPARARSRGAPRPPAPGPPAPGPPAPGPPAS